MNRFLTKSFLSIRSRIYRYIDVPLLGRFFRLLPIVNNKIVFDNFAGKGFADNPKYIAEELSLRPQKVKMIWLVENKSNYDFPVYIQKVKIHSVKALYERATAGIWVDNIRNLHPVRKRGKQIYLQTWHASFAYKRIEKDAEKELSEKYCAEAKYDGSITNGILVNSELLEQQYRRTFWLNDQVEYLRYGLPRYDFLFRYKNDREFAYRMREKYGIGQDAFIVLFAPTFRDDYSTEGYDLQYERVIQAFSEKTGKDVYLFVRFHPNAEEYSKSITYSEHLVNGSGIPDLQELSMISDCMITDYSTSLYDFVILQRPVFICALDLEHYHQLRGLLPEYYELPFPFSQTNDELIQNIKTFNNEKYFQTVNQYITDHPIYDNGNASKQVTDWILGKMGQKAH